MKKVIIVGNGKGVLDKRNGNIIDSYDIVVRLNRYRTKSYEEYVGTKTDCWVLNKCTYDLYDATKQDLFKMYQNKHKDYLKQKYYELKQQNVSTKIIKDYLRCYKANNLEVIEKIDPCLLHIFLIDSSLIKHKNLNYKCIDNSKHFSSGYVAINYFVEQNYDVTITGFDFFKKSSCYWLRTSKLVTEENLIHKRTFNDDHPYSLEEMLVKKLIIFKKVKIL